MKSFHRVPLCSTVLSHLTKQKETGIFRLPGTYTIAHQVSHKSSSPAQQIGKKDTDNLFVVVFLLGNITLQIFWA